MVARSKTCCSCVLDPRADSRRCCEGDPWIREVQGSLRRENFGGARTHRRRCTGANPCAAESEPGEKRSGGLRGARGSFCGGSGELGGDGVGKHGGAEVAPSRGYGGAVVRVWGGGASGMRWVPGGGLVVI